MAITDGYLTNIRTIFRNNTAAEGGAIAALSVFNLTNIDCQFLYNTGKDIGGAIFGDIKQLLVSKNNTFIGNNALTSGAIHLNTFINTIMNVSIEDDSYRDNHATVGIVQFKGKSRVTVLRVYFADNVVGDSYGAIVIENSVGEFRFQGGTMTGNIAKSGGFLTLLQAEKFLVEESVFMDNVIDVGAVIEVQSKSSGKVRESLFYHSKIPGSVMHISVQAKSVLTIELCEFTSDTLFEMPSQTQRVIDAITQQLVFRNVSFNLHTAGYAMKSSVSGVSYVQNITYTCPANFHPVSEFVNISFPGIFPSEDPINGTLLVTSEVNRDYYTAGSIQLECSGCGENTYNLHSSQYSLQPARSVTNKLTSHIEINEINTGICYPCPSGGQCLSNKVVALPGYWGFISDQRMHFEACPSQYCCESAPCVSHDSCQAGRAGRMCASCSKDYQLSMFSEACLESGTCSSTWISGIIIGTGFAYVGFLVFKVELVNIAIVISKVFRRKSKKIKESPKQSNNVELETTVARTEKIDEISQRPQIDPDHEPEKSHFTTDDIEVPFDYEETFYTIVYHLQDCALFIIRFPEKPESSLAIVDEYKDRLISIARLDVVGLMNLDLACLPVGTTPIQKLFIKISVVPLMLILVLSLSGVLKLAKVNDRIRIRIVATLLTVLIEIVLFSSQQISSATLNAVKCVWLGTGSYLHIDATIECYQPWQILVFIYLCLFVFSLWVTIFVGPGLLRYELISLNAFIIGLLFPGPFLVYSFWIIYKHRGQALKESCPNMNDSAILDEVWSGFKPFFNSKYFWSKYFCWGGIIELRRLALVICATLISDPVTQILTMMFVLQVFLIIQIIYEPYEDETANWFWNLSLFCTLMVGAINFGWATIMYTESGTPVGDALQIRKAYVTLEGALIQGVPVAIVLFCLVQFVVVNCWKVRSSLKEKGE